MEELGQRLSDDQIQAVLDCVAAHLPPAEADASLALPQAKHEEVREAPLPFGADADGSMMHEDEHDAFPEEHFEHDAGRNDDEPVDED